MATKQKSKQAKAVPKSVLAAVNKKYGTQRARYITLANKGYAQASIARAYGVTSKTIWMALTSRSIPTMK
jgi:DNA-binding phage protein